MPLQQTMVALIVTWCCGYAVWALLPDAARRALARRLLDLPLPSALQQRLRRAASQPTGCACDGCDAGKPAGARPAVAMVEQPIRIHRRLKGQSGT